MDILTQEIGDNAAALELISLTKNELVKDDREVTVITALDLCSKFSSYYKVEILEDEADITAKKTLESGHVKYKLWRYMFDIDRFYKYYGKEGYKELFSLSKLVTGT